MAPSFRLGAGLDVDSYDLHEEMFTAAENGNQCELSDLLAAWRCGGFDQDLIDGALHAAIMNGHPACVRQLMEHGASPEMHTLYEAAEHDASIDVWQALLDYGWDMDSCYEVYQPLIFRFLRVDAIRPTLHWFLSHGASLSARSSWGLTPLSWAAGYGPVAGLRILLEFADADTIGSSNALHEAASNKEQDRTEAMRLLVDELRVDVDALSAYGQRPSRLNRPESRPLHCAVRSGRREHVRFLLDRGAKIGGKNAEGLSVRAWAEKAAYMDGWKWVEEWFAENGRSFLAEEAEGGEQGR